MSKPIYLDYNGTTPVDPGVAAAMLPYLTEHFGNPSSAYSYGRVALKAVDHAREQVAGLLNGQPDEIVFTSGGTESNNMVIRGVAEAYGDSGHHMIISAIEHPAILEPCSFLSGKGFEVTILPVDSTGQVNPADLSGALRPDTILVSIMLANNEVGTLQPLAEIAALAHKRGVLVHTDAAQAVGKIPIDVQALGVDMLTIAGHKLYAPKGVGALFIRRPLRLPKFMLGASQENDHRAGTENVLEIVGLGEAAEIARRDMAHNRRVMASTRDRLWDGLADIPETRRNGHLVETLPNTLNVSFRGIYADRLLSHIEDRVAASAGAACHTGQVTISPVLKAMGVSLDYALGTIRLTTGKFTTDEEIDLAQGVIREAVETLRTR